MKPLFAFNMRAAFVCYLVFIVSTFASAQNVNDSSSNNSILTPGARLILIDSSFSFTEGPATDKKGNVFFTDQPNNNIWKYDINGKLSLFMHGTHRSNG